MGAHWTRHLSDPEGVTPKQDSAPTFDPMLGFPNGRKPRVMTATAEVYFIWSDHSEFHIKYRTKYNV